MDNRFLKDEKGFTGLEAAIVLIAFVVVAAVFSYVMLGAGFFTTQKSQEVVHTGVTQASSSISLAGDVIVKGATGGGKADQITFYITNTAGGTPVDLDKTVLTYVDDENFVSQEYVYDKTPVAPAPDIKGPHDIPPAGDALWANTFGWVYNGVIHTDGIASGDNIGDNLLSQGEKYKVVVDLPTLVTAAKEPLINEKFKIELKPPEGAVLTISRTLPPALVENDYYPVY